LAATDLNECYLMMDDGIQRNVYIWWEYVRYDLSTTTVGCNNSLGSRFFYNGSFSVSQNKSVVVVVCLSRVRLSSCSIFYYSSFNVLSTEINLCSVQQFIHAAFEFINLKPITKAIRLKKRTNMNILPPFKSFSVDETKRPYAKKSWKPESSVVTDASKDVEKTRERVAQSQDDIERLTLPPNDRYNVKAFYSASNPSPLGFQDR
jgi:hypothetical protein